MVLNRLVSWGSGKLKLAFFPWELLEETLLLSSGSIRISGLGEPRAVKGKAPHRCLRWKGQYQEPGTIWGQRFYGSHEPIHFLKPGGNFLKPNGVSYHLQVCFLISAVRKKMHDSCNPSVTIILEYGFIYVSKLVIGAKIIMETKLTDGKYIEIPWEKGSYLSYLILGLLGPFLAQN